MDEYRLLFFSSLNARNKDILRNLMVVNFSLNISYSVHQNIIKWKKGKFSQGATMLTSTGFSSRIPGNLKLLQLAAAVADKITLLELRSSTAQFSSFSEASSRFENQQIKTSGGDSGQLQQPSTLSSAHLSFESLYCCTNATSQAATDILQHT